MCLFKLFSDYFDKISKSYLFFLNTYLIIFFNFKQTSPINNFKKYLEQVQNPNVTT